MNRRTAATLCLLLASTGLHAGLVNRFGSVSVDAGNDVATDPQGNTVIAVAVTGASDFDRTSTTVIGGAGGLNDGVVAKYDSEGSLLWVATFGGLQSDVVTAVTTDSLGNVYAGGSFTGLADLDPGEAVVNRDDNGRRDAFLAKLDPLGNLLWLRNFGGSGEDTIHDLATGDDDSVYVTGAFTGSIDVDPLTAGGSLTAAGGTDGLYIHYRPDGVLEETFSIGGSGNDALTSIALTQTGSLYLAGNFQGTIDSDPGPTTRSFTSKGLSDILIGRFDLSGGYIWTKTVGGPGEDTVASGSAAVTTNSLLVLGGNFSGTAEFQTRTLTSAGSLDAFVLTTGPFGAIEQLVHFGGTGLDTIEALVSDSLGTIYLGGCFSATVDFDPGFGTVFHSASPGTSGAIPFVSRFSSDLSFVWARPFEITDPGSTTASLVAGLAIRGTGTSSIGRFSGILDAAEGSEVRSMESEGSHDIFVIDLNAEGRPASLPRSRLLRRN